MWVELPDANMAGLVFEHVEGVRPARGAGRGILIAAAKRLHADQDLARRIRPFGRAATVGQYFERIHVRRWDNDIDIIRKAEAPSAVDEPLLAWMEGEVRRLEQTVRDATAFQVPAEWPTHGDLYGGNTLVTDAGNLYVFDWDDLAIGDPVGDYILVLWSLARQNPTFDWGILGVKATDDGFADRMRFYARATLLDEVVDGLAEYVGLDATDSILASVSREKYGRFEQGLSSYRRRYRLTEE